MKYNRLPIIRGRIKSDWFKWKLNINLENPLYKNV